MQMITALASSSVSRRTICTVFNTSILAALFSFDSEINLKQNSKIKGNNSLFDVVLLKFFTQCVAIDT